MISMHPLVASAMVQGGTHMAAVIRMMFDGVAFRKDATTFDVYSHEGDDIGSLAAADVNYAIHLLKRMGRPVGKLTHITMQDNPKYSHEPAYTFAWVDWMMYNGRRM